MARESEDALLEAASRVRSECFVFFQVPVLELQAFFKAEPECDDLLQIELGVGGVRAF